MAGYAHPMAFKAITDDEILKAERFVREKTLSILQKNMNESINEGENCEVLIDDEQLRDYFGDLYAQDTTSFKFEAGDVLLIKELVDYVKQVADRNGKNTGLRHFTNEKVSMPKKSRALKSNAVVLVDHQRLKMDLEQKVSKCIQLHVPGIKLNSFNIEQVAVELFTEGEKVYGDIICNVCNAENKKNQKPKRVYYNLRKGGSGSWVMSNFVTHLIKMHPASTQSNDMECPVAEIVEMDAANNLACNENESEANGNENASVIFVDDGMSRDINKTIRDDPDILFKQLSSQITGTMATVLKNGDEKENINFCLGKSPRELTVAKIPKDGSCLFGSLAHQLWNYKIKSRKHLDATKKLRADVVEHILNPQNYSSFEFHLKDRVYENKNANEITNITTECKLFARHVLSKQKTWGGIETLLAVSELYSTNIVVFNEDGVCTKYKRNDCTHGRSIAVAHRFGLNVNANNEQIRDHFDSVSNIGSADLLEVVRHISK